MPLPTTRDRMIRNASERGDIVPISLMRVSSVTLVPLKCLDLHFHLIRRMDIIRRKCSLRQLQLPLPMSSVCIVHTTPRASQSRCER